ncbi:unnamed protein product [Aureobasidium mustum]|uniref:Uncharacterized protein n=1 Tax=Aureobasidium mustum TaxID=2773714 RepID=A0A9N8JHH4_9PEZI|nr:unnamed protein product [Aureobasidium mustum]
MADSNSQNPGAEPVAAESELSVAQMIQATEDLFREIKRFADDSQPLLDAWLSAVRHLARLKRGLEATQPGEIDAENIDLGHVDALNRMLQADKAESELLSVINDRIRLLKEMIDQLEYLTVRLKVKAWTTHGDSEVYDFVQESDDRAREIRKEAKDVAEKIIRSRQGIMAGL